MHLAKHGAGVEVVVDLDVGFGVGGPQDATDVLHHSAFEGEREGEEQRVEARGVEAFAEIGTGREQKLTGRGRVGGELIGHGGSGLLAQPAFEDERFEPAGGEIGGQRIEVFGPLGEDKHVATVTDGSGDVGGDLACSRCVVDERAEQVLDRSDLPGAG